VVPRARRRPGAARGGAQPSAEATPWGAPAAEDTSAHAEPAAPEELAAPDAWGASQAEPAQDVEQVQDVEQAPAAEEAPSFTSYSGYSGWAGGGAERPALEYTEPYAPFGRSLDEARAWHTGAIPVVPEPAPVAEPAWSGTTDAQPAWSADADAQPAWAAEPDAHPDWATPADAPQPAWAAASSASEPVVPTVELEPDDEEEVAAPWAPVAATPSSDAAEPAPLAARDTWQRPSWQQETSAAPAQAAPEAPASDEWRPAAPLWARPADAEQPTQMFSPIESADAVAPFDAPQAPAPQTAAPQAPAAFAAEAPVWPAAPAGPAAPVAQPAFSELVAPAEEKPRRRWGSFFSRKRDEPVAAPEAPQAAPAVPRTPVRSSAWGPDAAAPPVAPAQPAPDADAWQAPAWSAPAAPQQAPAPAPAPLGARTAPSWSPPEWASHQPAAPAATVPHPSVPPSAAPRVGTLDDEVAAMLALRSDIQEQALSELSQLSAYRPSAVGAGGSERLTKRVPSAVPAAPAPMEERPVQRDADQLRSRLSSFQSGTSRGRRASTGTENGDHQ
jgi:hypothetical protein